MSREEPQPRVAETPADQALAAAWAQRRLAAYLALEETLRQGITGLLTLAQTIRQDMEREAQQVLEQLASERARLLAEIQAARRERQALEQELQARRRAVEEELQRLRARTEAECAALLREAEARRTALLAEVAALEEQVRALEQGLGLLSSQIQALRQTRPGRPLSPPEAGAAGAAPPAEPPPSPAPPAPPVETPDEPRPNGRATVEPPPAPAADEPPGREVLVHGLGDFVRALEIQRLLQRMPGIRNVRAVNFDPDQGLLWLLIQHEPDLDLVAALKEQRALPLTLVRETAAALEYRYG